MRARRNEVMHDIAVSEVETLPCAIAVIELRHVPTGIPAAEM